VCYRYGSWYSKVYGETQCSGLPVWLSSINVTTSDGTTVRTERFYAACLGLRECTAGTDGDVYGGQGLSVRGAAVML
jgi:hypothetical protein